MLRKYFKVFILLSLLAYGVSALAASNSSEEAAATETAVAEIQAGTVWDGIYTEEQQERGQTAYENSCALCHGATLRGSPGGPGIAGNRFAAMWRDRSVGELLSYVQQNMPIGQAGSLPADTYADIVAYMFSVNEYPAGEVPLPSDADALEEVLITRAP